MNFAHSGRGLVKPYIASAIDLISRGHGSQFVAAGGRYGFTTMPPQLVHSLQARRVLTPYGYLASWCLVGSDEDDNAIEAFESQECLAGGSRP